MSGYATPPSSAGSAPKTTFVYRPGFGVNTPPIYNDWAVLYADFIASDGPVVIEIDDTLTTPAVIPAGAYTFRGDTTLSGFLEHVNVGGTICDLADGVTFVGLAHMDNVLNFRSLSSAPIITITSPNVLIMDKGSALIANGTSPFVFNDQDITVGFFYVVLLNGSRFDTGVDRVVRLEDPLTGNPAALAILLLDNSIVGSDTIESGGGNVAILTSLLSDVGLFSYSQPNYTSVNTINAAFTQETRNYWVLASGIQTFLYTAAAGELVRCDPSGGPMTITLPLSAAVPPGSWVVVKNQTDSANAIAVEAILADTIDGTPSPGAFVIAAARGVATFVSDGISDWMVVT